MEIKGVQRKKQRRLGEFSVDMTRLSWAKWGKGRRGKEREEPGAAARSSNVKIKQSGLYREEPLVTGRD